MARTKEANRQRKRRQRERRYAQGLTARGAPRVKAPKANTLAWALWQLGVAQRAGLLPVAARRPSS